MAWSGYSEKGQGSLERGPGTFAVDVPGIVQKPDGADFVGVKATGDMRSSGRLSVPAGVPQDNTISELVKMGQALLAPKIKEEQDRRFIEGMTRAASGVALQEIIDEQPAYVTIFGEAPAVEGARAYTTAARASAWTAQQQNNMSELAKIDTNDLGKVVQASMAEQLTGDPIADADIQKAMLGAMPDLIRTQTKARFLHLQKEAKAARRTAMAATAEQYTAVFNAEPGTVGVDQMDKAEGAVMEVFTPPPGVDEESHKEDLTDTLTMQLGAGNFDVTRLAYESGIIGQLSPEQQSKVRVAALRAAPAALAKVMPKFIPQIVALGAANLPPEEFVKQVQALNAAAAGESRVPEEYGQLLGEDYMLRGAAAATGRMATATEKKLLAEKKAVAEQGKAVLLAGVIDDALSKPDAGGDLQFSTIEALLPNLAFKTTEVDAALGRKLLSSSDPVAQAAVLNKFGGSTISVGKDLVATMWQSTSREGAKWETHGAQFGKMITMYENLNEAAKDRYFTTEQQNTLDRWMTGMSTDAATPETRARDVQALFETRMSRDRTDTSRLREDPDSATAEGVVMKTLERQLTTGLWRSDAPLDADQVTNTNVGAVEMQAARAIVTGGMRKYSGPISQEQRADRALHGAIREGVMSVHGGRLIFNEQPGEVLKRSLGQAIGQNNESAALALERVISSRISARQGDDDTRFVIRAPGLPIKYVVQFNQGDKTIIEIVTEDDVRKEINTAPAKKPSGRGTRPANPVN